MHQLLSAGGQVRGQMGADGQLGSRSGQSHARKVTERLQTAVRRSNVLPCVLLHQGSYVTKNQKVSSVKAEVVDYAREKWPMFFSRFFKVVKLSGRPKCRQHC